MAEDGAGAFALVLCPCPAGHNTFGGTPKYYCVIAWRSRAQEKREGGALMSLTISTHNGSSVDLAHDLREKWRIEQENKNWAERHPGQLRIDLSKEHEVLINRGTLAQVYHQLFDDALKEFNEKQIRGGKKERVIKNYLSDIRAKEKTSKAAKHPVYELITQVGSKENPITDDMAEKILKEHAAGFEQRNPHLHVVAQVLHKDEIGGMHIHTAYIPVATEQARGMRVQNSLTAALKQQGIVGDKYSDTAQMRWEKQENKALEAICNKYGFEVEHPQAGTKAEHLTVEEYRMEKEIAEKEKELSKIQNLPAGMTVVKKARLEQLEDAEKQYHEDKRLIEQAKRDLKAANQTMDAAVKQQEQLARQQREFDEEVNEAANQKVSVMRDNSLRFIRTMGLWEKFLDFVESLREKMTQKM